MSEHYRREFRNFKKKHNETYTQLGCRLDCLLTGWSGVKTKEALMQLISLEQFYSTVSPEYRWHI